MYLRPRERELEKDADEFAGMNSVEEIVEHLREHIPDLPELLAKPSRPPRK
jgi:hypothetical protein